MYCALMLILANIKSKFEQAKQKIILGLVGLLE